MMMMMMMSVLIHSCPSQSVIGHFANIVRRKQNGLIAKYLKYRKVIFFFYVSVAGDVVS